MSDVQIPDGSVLDLVTHAGTTRPYVHIEYLSGAQTVHLDTNGVTTGQALELIVEGLDAIKEEAQDLGPQTAVSEVELNAGSYVHIELSSLGLVSVQTKRSNISQALKLIVGGMEILKKRAAVAGPVTAAELLLPE